MHENNYVIVPVNILTPVSVCPGLLPCILMLLLKCKIILSANKFGYSVSLNTMYFYHMWLFVSRNKK